jgi:hypothetical protein
LRFQLVDLQLSDAVFGADAAAAFCHQVVHRAFELLLAREKSLAVCVGALVQVEVQVAIARMAVGDQVAFGCKPRGQRGAPLDERRQRGYRYADVVFQTATGAALRLRHRFPQLPEGIALIDAAGEHRVDDEAGFHGLRQRTFQQSVQIRARRAREFHQQVPGR